MSDLLVIYDHPMQDLSQLSLQMFFKIIEQE